MDIRIEVDRDYLTIERSKYKILDVLSGIGGILSVFMSGLSMFIGIWNYNNFDNYMVSHLYKTCSSEQD